MSAVAQARVGDDAAQVGQRDEDQVARAEDHGAGLHQRHVPLGHAIDHEFGDARVIEDGLDDDHAAQQVGQRQRHRVGDGPHRVGQRMRHHGAQRRGALEPDHFDVGGLQLVADGRAGHAHHLRHDHAAQAEHRHREGAQHLAHGFDVVHIGQGRQPAQLHREHQHREGGDQELRHGHHRHRPGGDHPVEPRAPPHRAGDAERQRDGHREQRRHRREQQRIGQPARDQFAHRHLRRRRHAQVAPDRPAQPAHVAQGRGHVQPHLRPQRGQRLGRGVLAELLLRRIAGQHGSDGEHDGRHREQRQQREQHALRQELENHTVHEGSVSVVHGVTRRPPGMKPARPKPAAAEQGPPRSEGCVPPARLAQQGESGGSGAAARGGVPVF